MPEPKKLTLEELRKAVHGDAVAIRGRSWLQGAGGFFDKVFPPTYVKEGRSENKYAFERRVSGNDKVSDVVLLDSVASQANRIEEALLEGWEREELPIPVVGVDFSGDNELADLGFITSLQAPHRIADAILRDSVQDGTPFRQTEIGRACTDSRVDNATGMYKHCPTALIFGVWDSTGPRGGQGAKFQRCLVSEIVGIDAVAGVKTGSRIDPLGIEKKAGPVYHLKENESDWTTQEEDAAKEKGKPRLFSRKGVGEKGSPAEINHSNIPPSIDAKAGGVTFSHAEHTVVLSLAGLRRLRFRMDTEGKPLDKKARPDVETDARTALAALALAGVEYQQQIGYDLRSRSLLIPRGPLSLELVRRDGQTEEVVVEDAARLLADAVEAARKSGMGWETDEVRLQPTPALLDLIKKSRVLTGAGGGDEEG